MNNDDFVMHVPVTVACCQVHDATIAELRAQLAAANQRAFVLWDALGKALMAWIARPEIEPVAVRQMREYLENVHNKNHPVIADAAPPAPTAVAQAEQAASCDRCGYEAFGAKCARCHRQVCGACFSYHHCNALLAAEREAQTKGASDE